MVNFVANLRQSLTAAPIYGTVFYDTTFYGIVLYGTMNAKYFVSLHASESVKTAVLMPFSEAFSPALCIQCHGAETGGTPRGLILERYRTKSYLQVGS